MAGAMLVALWATFAFIDLEVALDLGPWHANAPVADLVALALLMLALPDPALRRLPLPGPRAWAAFVALGLVSALLGPTTPESLHFMLRKPIFMYLAYAVGVAAWARRAALQPALLGGLLIGMGGTAALSLATSGLRVAAGDALWFSRLDGLTPNHKTLAVALAGALPLVLAIGRQPRWRRPARAAALVVTVAIALSLSKTAWITAALAYGLFWPRARPIAARWQRTAPALVLGAALAVYAPVLLGSKAMLDAARSRHSLNVRAWEMVRARPMLGMGPGSSTRVEQVTFPHYRVNGVDAHGVVQKVGSEVGLLGLLAYGLFVAGAGRRLVGRWREAGGGHDSLAWGAVATWATLHTNLLLSTEAFSPTHWTPLAVAWGLAHAAPASDPPEPA
jgi:O-antigen ligase